MRLRNRHSFLASRPEGRPPPNPASRVTQFLYFGVLAAVVGYVAWYGVTRYLNYTLRAQIQCERTVIGAARPGTLRGLSVAEGDRVTAGQVLGRIDPPAACAARDDGRAVALQGDIQVRRARLDAVRGRLAEVDQRLRRAELRRALELDVAPRDDAARLQERRGEMLAERRVLEAEIAAARARLAAERRVPEVPPDCQSQELRAPADAIVVALHLGPDEVARTGDAVLSLVRDDAPVWVVAYLENGRRDDVVPGEAVTVRLPDRTDSPGRIATVRSSAAEFSGNKWDAYRLEEAEVVLEILPEDTATARRWMGFERMEVEVRGSR